MLTSVLLVAVAGCSLTVWQPNVQPATAPVSTEAAEAPLKVHLRDGQLIVLSSWQEMAGDSGLTGEGSRFDPRRQPIGSGHFTIPRDSIALLETNQKTVARPAGLTGLAVWTVLLGTTTVACLDDPKACFGSCPTFYASESADRPVAEGFSGSVSRSLEATDLDHLITLRPHGRTVALTMRNEALETHAVRSLRLMVVPRPPAGRVFATQDGRFLETTEPLEPVACRAAGENCLAAVRHYDGRERWSEADSTDLAAEELVEVTFPALSGALGLVVGARQSLLSTYRFYQTIAYTGRSAAAWLARLERQGAAGLAQPLAMMAQVGTIGIDRAADDDEWRPVGTFREPGPLAADVAVIPVGEGGSGRPITVRLRLTRGGWRLGYLGLVRLTGPATPAPLEPVRVVRDGVPDSLALVRLLDPDRYLVTYPGDRYRIEFELPRDGKGLELFLESRGYYYEWMRPEWVAEEDLARLAVVGSDPREALRLLAPGFKLRERDLERRFWASRLGRK
jgi:hypothetical protein